MNDLTDKQRMKRKQILEAAVSCFIEKGFHATSTAEICKAANMSPGNLFHYYSTKYAIIEAIVMEDSEELIQILNSSPEGLSPITHIETLLTNLIRLYNEPGYARISIEIIAEASRNPNINKIFIESEKKIREQLILLLDKGIRCGEIDSNINTKDIASWLLILTDGSIGRELMEPDFNWENSLNSLYLLIRKVLSPSKIN